MRIIHTRTITGIENYSNIAQRLNDLEIPYDRALDIAIERLESFFPNHKWVDFKPVNEVYNGYIREMYVTDISNNHYIFKISVENNSAELQPITK